MLTFQMQSVVPSRHNKATKIAYFASAVHANCLRIVALNGYPGSQRFSKRRAMKCDKRSTKR